MIPELTISQHQALRVLQSSANVFLTGVPGSGKSFLIAYYLNMLPQKFPILASTGAAAILVGGRTFHSFFGLGIMQGGAAATLEQAKQNKRLRSRLRKSNTVVIDEISMISADTLDVAEAIAKFHRESEAPWGGMRVIVVGDFAQLPPVSKIKGQKPWAFLSNAWRRSQFQCVELREIKRTDDVEFLSVLNDVRKGRVSTRVEKFLESRQSDDEFFEGTTLFPRRNQTDQFNQAKLMELEGELFTFETVYGGDGRAVEMLQREAPIVSRLELKKGARVMFRINDPKQRFVNGTTGTVKELGEDFVMVTVKDRVIDVEKFKFTYCNADGEVMAFAENFPLSLAYAGTIHRTQGATLDEIRVDLAGLWEPGQAYVALSRARSGEGVKISRWTPESIMADPEVEAFYNRTIPDYKIDGSDLSF